MNNFGWPDSKNEVDLALETGLPNEKRYRNWKLAAMAGSHTLPHIDSDGHATWVYVVNGIKLWGLPRLKNGIKVDPKDLSAKISTCDENILEMPLLVLRPGSVLLVYLLASSFHSHNPPTYLGFNLPTVGIQYTRPKGRSASVGISSTCTA